MLQWLENKREYESFKFMEKAVQDTERKPMQKIWTNYTGCTDACNIEGNE